MKALRVIFQMLGNMTICLICTLLLCFGLRFALRPYKLPASVGGLLYLPVMATLGRSIEKYHMRKNARSKQTGL
jgi:hypothetical protein